MVLFKNEPENVLESKNILKEALKEKIFSSGKERIQILWILCHIRSYCFFFYCTRI